MNSVKMKVNPRIIEHLGTDLITSSAVALLELIKNSIDAYSTQVNIQLFTDFQHILNNQHMLSEVGDEILNLVEQYYTDKNILLIEDVGIGMNQQQLENGFLNIGTDIKHKISGKNSLGEKGIGRLATQRLGNKVIVETASKDDSKSKIVVIDWDTLIHATNINDVELPYFEIQKYAETYTRLWILGAESSELVNEPKQLSVFKEVDITLKDELKSSAAFIISPFEECEHKTKISFFYDGIQLESGLDLNLLQFAESQHSFNLSKNEDGLCLEMKLQLTPQFIEKTHRSCIKPIGHFPKYRVEKEEYVNMFQKYKYRYETTLHVVLSEEQVVNKIKELRKKNYENIKNNRDFDELLIKKTRENLKEIFEILPINGRVYNLKQDNAVGKMYIDFVQDMSKTFNQDLEVYSVSDVQKFLSLYNGIKLYRNVYRIGALGNKDDDWLEMQQYRTSGQQFYRINQGNAIGFVSVNDPTQSKIREISSRLDIVENEAAKMFKELMIVIFNYYFYDFNKSADDITKSILRDEGLLQDDINHEVIKQKEENHKLLEENKKLLKEIKRTKKILEDSAVQDGESLKIPQGTYQATIDILEAADNQVTATQQKLGETKEVLETAESGLREIEVEAFNNYKLMANGLITETITHEMHSIVNDRSMYSIESDFEKLKQYLYENNIPLFNKHLLPIKDQSDLLYSKVEEISDLYNFLEKTFIKKNNYDEYATENVEQTVLMIADKLEMDLQKNEITLDVVGLTAQWYMPKGVLLHVLYNLISNSIYWIDIKKKRALKEQKYYSTQNKIVIEQKSSTNIWVYDTGIGVLNKMQYVLFDALQSGKEHDGRGMGLYIVKKLLNSFKADIELLEDMNEFGNRYIFSITVPKQCTK